MRLGHSDERGHQITITVDEEPLAAFEGETIAGALLAAGRRAWRRTRRGQPRGLFCGIGLCFDCLVTVDGTPDVRACLTPVREGMVVETRRAGVKV
ncbi:MAG: (2Fe-2S)-binding protein [Chloroflexi bacterium]|nr:(2Fe-2S)-binding protein [Chloroflexota bacterium]